ncbi:MAG: GH36-type glycosyl hydrolase domain-containing protein [Bacillota bacterium]
MSEKFENQYGYFTEDGKEYVITDPETPRPWANIISNGDYSFMVSQAGGGYSWRGNSHENRLTRNFQDVIKDNWGKYIYIRDDESDEYWSAGWQPVQKEAQSFEVRHGIGYSVLSQKIKDIQSDLKMFVVPDEPLELWELTLENESDRTRKLSLFSFLEWNLGSPDEHREFNKIFIDNDYEDQIGGFIATKRRWSLLNEKGQANNRSWEYAGFHSVSEKPVAYDGDKESFIGMYNSDRSPRALDQEKLAGNEGKFGDAIASLQVQVELAPGESKTLVFTLGCADDKQQARELAQKYDSPQAAEEAFQQVKEFWQPFIESSQVETPDQAMNVMTNVWLKYQAISCRIWGKSAYYQSSGGYGYRDQLQDCQVFFNNLPEYARKQILLHAEKQKTDGTVLHWWMTISGNGPESDCSDDLLWLPYITINYLKETNDFSILNEVKPYLDGGEGTLYEHCRKSIERAFQRFSPRGITLMGSHDWNDGLSAVGWDWKGESFWVAEFLSVILDDFADIAREFADDKFADKCEEVQSFLRKTVNQYGWDGQWYLQATTDNGDPLGSKENEEGWIYLNPQTWAVMSGIADQKRAETCMNSVTEHLDRDYGPVLLYPAYSEPRSDIGYITRYAPGLRENGGVYTHAATWAIVAYTMLGETEKAYDIYRKVCPPNRSNDIELYKAEPYVVPGNSDGPDSENYGQAGWSWYTGSAQWLQRVATHWILGVRPDYDGLLIDPAIPEEWDGFFYQRKFRGAIYNIEVQNEAHVSQGVEEIYFDGEKIEGQKLPVVDDDREHDVQVIMG